MIEDIKKDINNSLKKIQEITGKQVEAIKEETHTQKKPLKITGKYNQSGEEIE